MAMTASIHVFPSLPRPHLAYDAAVNAIHVGNRGVGSRGLADVPNSIFGQFRQRPHRSSRLTALGGHIRDVICRSAQKQMTGIHAWSVVTAVANGHSGWNLPVMDGVAYPVGALLPLPPDAKKPVSGRYNPPAPKPTIVRSTSGHEYPEAFPYQIVRDVQPHSLAATIRRTVRCAIVQAVALDIKRNPARFTGNLWSLFPLRGPSARLGTKQRGFSSAPKFNPTMSARGGAKRSTNIIRHERIMTMIGPKINRDAV